MRKFISRSFRAAFLSLVLLALPSFAAAPDKEHAAFLKAEKAIKQGKIRTFKKLAKSLTEHPLYPYLELAQLERRLTHRPIRDINDFIFTHEGTPLAERLSRRWLNLLVKQRRWKEYLAFYQPSDKVSLQCYRLRALYNTGQKKQALDEVSPLWNVGKSQPKACDSIFALWLADKRLTKDLLWSRLEKAVVANETLLVRYLTKLLPYQETHLVKLWQNVRKKPMLLAKKSKFNFKFAQTENIIVYGMKRLGYQNSDKAQTLWQKIRTQYPLSLQSKNLIERELALAMATDFHEDAAKSLSAVPAAVHDLRTKEWQVRTALLDEDWNSVVETISTMPVSAQNDIRWQYWLARALAEQGRVLEAKGIFSDLAETRHYYGFLASAQLEKAPVFNHDALEVDPDMVQAVMAYPGMRRAKAFYELGRTVDAVREWRDVTVRFNDKQLQQAALLARDWGQASQAIATITKSEVKDDLLLRYPLVHRSAISSGASSNGLPEQWVYAVARQESIFQPKVISSAGAMGIMQLRPSTARAVARRLKVRFHSKHDLLKPERNIALGSRYLQELRKKFKGQLIYATAAYNAGPARVKQWLKLTAALPLDSWVEVVPYAETRSYLKNVLAGMAIYEKHLGQKPSMASLLKGQSIPSKTTIDYAKGTK